MDQWCTPRPRVSQLTQRINCAGNGSMYSELQQTDNHAQIPAWSCYGNFKRQTLQNTCILVELLQQGSLAIKKALQEQGFSPQKHAAPTDNRCHHNGQSGSLPGGQVTVGHLRMHHFLAVSLLWVGTFQIFSPTIAAIWWPLLVGWAFSNSLVQQTFQEKQQCVWQIGSILPICPRGIHTFGAASSSSSTRTSGTTEGFSLSGGSDEITTSASVSGYGNASSTLTIDIVEEDNGATYYCDIDVGDVRSAVRRTMVVRLGLHLSAKSKKKQGRLSASRPHGHRFGMDVCPQPQEQQRQWQWL